MCPKLGPSPVLTNPVKGAKLKVGSKKKKKKEGDFNVTTFERGTKKASEPRKSTSRILK